MKQRSILLVPLVALLALLHAIGSAQQPAKDTPTDRVQRIPRFAGTTQLEGKEVRVSIDTWQVLDRTKLDALKLPLQGVTVVELRGGHLYTVIQGKRERRETGDFWTLPSEVDMGIETEDDSAALQTTTVAR
jgi:hypothetical protein